DEGGGDDEEEGESNEEDDNEETKEEESFDPIPKTPKGSKDEGDGEEDQGLNQESSSVSSQFITSMLNLTSDADMESIFATASTSVAPFPITAPTMTPSTITTITITNQAPIPPTPISSESVKAQLKAEVLTRSSYSSRTSYAVAADLSEMELKKILIERMEGNKSIQRSDEQRNLYKALVDAYEVDKIILDSYRETIILKRRRKEHESASALLETATRSAGRSTTGSKSRQASASESAFAEEPVQTTSQIEEPSHPVFETGAEDQPIVQSS
nr:hypothetical protein [Tanacetum cinerariifolium]